MTTANAASSSGAEVTGDANAAPVTKNPSSKWADPQVPIGNGPALPKWPLIVAWSAWIIWVGFLFAMLVSG